MPRIVDSKRNGDWMSRGTDTSGSDTSVHELIMKMLKHDALALRERKTPAAH